MEEWERKHITENLPALIKVTTCTQPLLQCLMSDGIISMEDIQNIEGSIGHVAKAHKLYDILATRKDSFNSLLNALQTTCQTGAATILDRVYTSTNFRKKVGEIAYDKRNLLGTGCYFTKVYKGTFGKRTVAVKVINSEFIPTTVALKEVKFLVKCPPHENVVQCFGAQVRDDFILIALELCDQTLSSWVNSKTEMAKSEATEVNILRQITAGLHHLHNLQIVHRDIKPDNILLVRKTENKVLAKISDFGLSRRLNGERSTFTFHSTSGFGTLDWASPETMQYHYNDNIQNKGPLHMTRAVDIFSLGCVFYYVISSGGHPFGSSKARRSGNIIDGTPVIDVKEIKIAHVPHLLLICSMITVKPKERPSSEAILSHPIFWGNERTLEFIRSVHYCLGTGEEKFRSAGARLESLKNLVIGRTYTSWSKFACPKMQNYLKKKTCTTNSMLSLLQTIVSTSQHFDHPRNELKGAIEDSTMDYWKLRFPFFVDVLWMVFRGVLPVQSLNEYYEEEFNFELKEAEKIMLSYYESHKNIIMFAKPFPDNLEYPNKEFSEENETTSQQSRIELPEPYVNEVISPALTAISPTPFWKTSSISFDEDIHRISSQCAHMDMDGDCSDSFKNIAKQLIQFIRDRDGHFSFILKEIILDQVLSTAGTLPIAVISVTGVTTLLKQSLFCYLIRCLEELERNDILETIDKTNPPMVPYPETIEYKREGIGVWIWSRAFVLERNGFQFAVLVLDTHGYDETRTSQEEQLALLELSLLLSSTAIVSLSADMPCDMLKTLTNILKLGQLIIENDEEGTTPPFQCISFLVDEFENNVNYPAGKVGGQRLFHDKVLLEEGLTGRAAINHKSLSEAFKNSYKISECWLFPNEQHQELSRSENSQITRESSSTHLLSKYVKNTMNSDNLLVKTIIDTAITRSELRKLIMSYVDYYNINKHSKAMELWDITAKVYHDSIIEKAIQKYDDHLDTCVKSPDVSVTNEAKHHSQACEKAFAEFRKARKLVQYETECWHILNTKIANAHENRFGGMGVSNQRFEFKSIPHPSSIVSAPSFPSTHTDSQVINEPMKFYATNHKAGKNRQKSPYTKPDNFAEKLIVGDNECSIQRIVGCALNIGHISILFENILPLARRLEVPFPILRIVENDLRTGEFNAALRNVLLGFVASNGSDATLAKLVTALRRLQLNRVADKLLQDFGTTNNLS